MVSGRFERFVPKVTDMPDKGVRVVNRIDFPAGLASLMER
jgi:hypothetical protein